MPLTLHAAVVPSFRQMLGAMIGLIDKAETFCGERGVEPAALLRARLAEDMFPLGYQLKSTAAHSQGAIEGVRKGVFAPDLAPPADSFDGQRERLREAMDFLAGIDPMEMEAWFGRDMRFEFGDFRMDFAAEDFLLSFSQPNFYFHATTAYDILRAQGLAIGKRDFAGAVRFRG